MVRGRIRSGARRCVTSFLESRDWAEAGSRVFVLGLRRQEKMGQADCVSQSGGAG